MAKIILAHSELTHIIYAIIGNEKIDITEQAIAEVKAVEALRQKPKSNDDCISRQTAIKNVAQIAKTVAKSDKQKSLCGRIIFMLEHMSEEKNDGQ